MLAGFTPWVDNFMHLTGFVTGILMGLALQARARAPPEAPVAAEPAQCVTATTTTFGWPAGDGDSMRALCRRGEQQARLWWAGCRHEV